MSCLKSLTSLSNFKSLALLSLVLSVVACGPRVEKSSKDQERLAAAATVVMSENDQALQQLLNGSRLTGSFTMKGKHAIDGVAKDSYVIQSLEKVSDVRWRFMVRISYMKTDVTVPLFLPIRWAGDTAVICVDDVFVPGIGTYSARVLFDKNRYAGTWSGDDYGGHLFGLVEPLNE